MTIRPAAPADLETIYAIWLDGIAHSFVGFAHPADLREQFAANFHAARPPFGFWVAEVDGQVVGWQSLLPCTSNPLKRQLLAESSTYVAGGRQYQGTGDALLRAALTEASEGDLQFVLAYTLAGNAAVGRLYARCGFVAGGELPAPRVPPLHPPKVHWVYAVPPLAVVVEQVAAVTSRTA